MTLPQITLFFIGIVVVVVVAMFVHGYLDKRKIKRGLEQIAQRGGGSVLQESLFDYPRLQSEQNGRRFDLFFDIAKVGRHHILYSVYSLSVSLPHSFFLIKKDAYRPIKDQEQFTKEHGVCFSDPADAFEGRSLFPEWAAQVCRRHDVKETLCNFVSFSSLQCGPDAIVVGKPYEGDETNSENVLHSLKLLETLAEQLEGAVNAPAVS